MVRPSTRTMSVPPRVFGILREGFRLPALSPLPPYAAVAGLADQPIHPFPASRACAMGSESQAALAPPGVAVLMLPWWLCWSLKCPPCRWRLPAPLAIGEQALAGSRLKHRLFARSSDA